MAQLKFFAAAADHRAVIEFLFHGTDVRVFESHSAFGENLREFRSFEDLERTYAVGSDEHGNGTAVTLALWSPTVMERLEIERIALDPARCQGHTFRYAMKGWAVMQLHLGGVHRRVITASYFGHNSEKRARAWGHAEGVNWSRLNQISGRVQYHVRQRLAVAMVPGRPVLPQAHELAKAGYTLKEVANASWAYPPPNPR